MLHWKSLSDDRAAFTEETGPSLYPELCARQSEHNQECSNTPVLPSEVAPRLQVAGSNSLDFDSSN